MRPNYRGELDKADLFWQSIVMMFWAHTIDFCQWAIGAANIDRTEVAPLIESVSRRDRGGVDITHRQRDTVGIVFTLASGERGGGKRGCAILGQQVGL